MRLSTRLGLTGGVGFWEQIWAAVAFGPRGRAGVAGVVGLAATLAKDAIFLPCFLPVLPAVLDGICRAPPDAPEGAGLAMAGETSLIGAGEGAESRKGWTGVSIISAGILED